jgi:prevent-host-death family protein
METTVSVTQARDNLPTLIRQVRSGAPPVVITNRNQPQVVILGYEAYQRSQHLALSGAHNLLQQLVAQAQTLLGEAREGLEPGSVESALYLDTLQEIARRVWEVTRLLGKPQRMLGVTILSAILNYRESGQALSEPQLEALSGALSLLLEDELDLEKVGQADQRLLETGLDAVFPVEGDLASLYEVTD